MILLAYTETGPGWGGPVEPWEIHPILTHFPIAFLLGGLAVDVYARWRGRPDLGRAASGLLIAGVLTAVLAALAGVLAFVTVPAHTEQAHGLMYWHLGIQSASLVLFAWPAWVRWRQGLVPPPAGARLAEWAAALLLVVGSSLGGYIVYHGGAGVEPRLLAPEVRGSHAHVGGGPEPQPPTSPGGAGHGQGH